MKRRKLLTPRDVIDFLRAIHQGKITLTSRKSPQDVYAGNVFYTASNGWTIVVFNDCNEWDYLDSIRTNDGRVIDHDDMEGPRWERVRRYRNELTRDDQWRCYGIPGYLQYSTKQWSGLALERTQ